MTQWISTVSGTAFLLMFLASSSLPAVNRRDATPPVPSLQESNAFSLPPGDPAGRRRPSPAAAPALPAAPARTFTVTTTADTGTGTLRRAIEDANVSPGRDVIEFAIPGFGVQTISPRSALPFINDPVIIDGTTQTGYSGTPLIELDGTNAGNAVGLDISAGSSIVKGMVINRFAGNGILLWLAGGNSVEGSFIGTDATGTVGLGNGGSGIAVMSSGNTVGNPAGAINIISGNAQSGVIISGLPAGGNRVVHTYIGLGSDGANAVGNGLAGIYIRNSSSDTIGGQLPGERNVISGNHESGISIRGQSSRSILIQGNYIGTEAGGSLSLGNLKNGIEILPENGSAGTPGLVTIGGPAPQAKNLISGNLSGGIAFFPDSAGGDGNAIVGNLIGTDIGGTAKVPNVLGGIFVRKYASSDAGILIGGSYADSGNVISGNYQFGIWIRGSGAKHTSIRGNYIGTSRESLSGITSLENQYAGIFLDNAPANMVGGESPVAGNVIGGNGGEGIAITGDTAIGNSILNNFIGTNPGDVVALGNRGHGIYIEASRTVIGNAGGANIIAHNRSRGVFVFSGAANTIRFNSIHDNDSLGIDLSPERLTPNDRKDADVGANDLQNFPLLDSASLSADSIRIKGRFDSEPGMAYTIDFYRSKSRNSSHFGEGETYIGSVTVRCDTGGLTDLDVSLPVHVSDNEFISATATDSAGNTSEFSRALCLKDSDGDGIMDCWETQGDGIDVNADGVIDYDLWAKGARPDHKDIFVEVDWMAGFRPNDTAIAMVVNSFKDVPNRYVNNPDAKPGIHLVAEVSADTLPWLIWQPDPWPEFFENKKYTFGTDPEWQSPNRVNILEAKRLVYRYCVFGDHFNAAGNSGVSETSAGAVGNDFIVSLGTFAIPGGDKFQQAGTFMHELGHTLGLQHGGGDEKTNKPNYYSVMNYTWQFPKKDGSLSDLTWKLDYSVATLPALTENSLNEAAGLAPQAADYPAPILVPYAGPGGVARIGLLYPGTAVDWDGNGDSSGHAAQAVDINNLDDPPSPSPGETLAGFSDWPNLKYNFRNSPNFRDPSPPELRALAGTATSGGEDEMTPAMDAHIQSLPPYGIVPAYRAPSLAAYETDSVLVGGNWGTLLVIINGTAPAGNLTFHLESSDTSIARVDSVAVIWEGNTQQTFDIETRGVAADTSVTISIVDAGVPASITIPVKAASMTAFTADMNKSCTVANEFGAQHRVMSGKAVHFQCRLDGSTPAGGGLLRLTSSNRSVLAPDSVITIPARQSGFDFALVPADSNGSAIITAVYRGRVFSDTADVVPGPRYSLVDLAPPGSKKSHAWKVNNNGQVLISSTDTLGLRSFFIWHDGQFDRLDASVGFRLIGVNDMNDSGWIAGVYSVDPDAVLYDSQPVHAAVWKRGQTTIFPDSLFPQPRSRALRINNNGTVLGYSYVYSSNNNPIYNEHAWVWNDAGVTLLGTPSAARPYTVGYGLNDSGDVTGISFQDDYIWGWTGWHGFLWKNSSFTEDWTGAIPQAINNNGGAAGTWNDQRWFWYTQADTKLFYMNDGSGSAQVRGMNDKGDVTGYWWDMSSVDVYPNAGFAYIGGWQYRCDCLANLPAGWSRLHKGESINNKGQIVGYGNAEPTEIERETQRAYLLDPVSSPTGVQGDDTRGTIPSSYRLHQNYPNPFNPTTTISFDLPARSFVSLKIFDLLGREVASLVSQELPAGRYSEQWHAGSMPTGVYFYRLGANGHIETRKLLLVR